MAEDKKERLTLTDEDIVTSPKISRRRLLAGAGVALGGVALAGRPAFADDTDKDADKDDDKDPEDDKGPDDKDPDGDEGPDDKDPEDDKGPDDKDPDDERDSD